MGDRLFLIQCTFEQARHTNAVFAQVLNFSGIGTFESPVGLFAAVEPPAPLLVIFFEDAAQEHVATPAGYEGHTAMSLPRNLYLEKRPG